MKKRVFTFLAAIIFGTVAVPIFNLTTTKPTREQRWWEQSFLYNMDFAERLAAKVLYPIGISTDPAEVIVGSDGWLFLGDKYDRTLTADRSPQTEIDLQLGQQIGKATEAWSRYLETKGVQAFRIMMAPNKTTIYREFVPRWARPFSPNATDALISGTQSGTYIDLRAPLLAAKKTATDPLYQKTDTHWNPLGAAIAFQALAQSVGATVQWPPFSDYEVVNHNQLQGRDLARLLRIEQSFSESVPILEAQSRPIETTIIDFNTGQIVSTGSDPTVVSAMKPIVVRTKGALNKKRVLWLRDSFGLATSPLMAVTFSDVLQLHWSKAKQPEERLLSLIDRFKPDFVFITVVERAARDRWFTSYPPPTVVDRDPSFQPSHTTIVTAINDLATLEPNRKFSVRGKNAFLDLQLKKPVEGKEVAFLDFKLQCDDQSSSVPLRLFWLGDGKKKFTDDHSAKFSFPTGRRMLALKSLPDWESTTAIERVRLQFRNQRHCKVFTLALPSFGQRRLEEDRTISPPN